MSRRLLIALAVSVCPGLLPTGLASAQTDTSPPVLELFSFTPTAIDVSSSNVIVLATFQVSDDISGVQTAGVTFTSPGSPLEFKSCTASTPISGTPLAGTFECSISFPQGAQSGVWNVLQVESQDVAGNIALYFSSTLADAGFPTALTVSQQPDVTPPTLLDFDFSPAGIDTLAGPATVLAMFEVDDDFSGIAWIKTGFISPGSTSILRGCTSVVYNPGGVGVGAEAAGMFDCQVSFPQFSESGIWTVTNVDASDIAGNIRSYSTADLIGLGFPTALNVVSFSDLTPPAMLDFSFAPESLDPTAAATMVPVTVHATDDLAGIASIDVTFAAPGGAGQDAECSSSTPATGSNLDGIYSCSVPVPRFSPEGIWPVSLEIRDQVGNLTRFDAAALAALSLPDDLTIGYLDGPPAATIAAPPDGRSVRGNSLTVRGRLALGSPADLSSSLGVRFEYRMLPFGVFSSIPAAHAAHPNPDTDAPFLVHWDTSTVPDGDYELRAVAHDLAGNPDPAAPAVTITIDNSGSTDIDETVNLEGLQESRTAVDDATDSSVASADLQAGGPAASWDAPSGSIASAGDILQVVFVAAAGEISRLEQPEQDLGAYVDLSLLSGQPTLDNGRSADLTLTYLDSDQDGVIDGTATREDEVELRRHDATSDAYLLVAGSVVLVEHNLVHAAVDALGRYALVGPLQPRIGFLSDGASLTWPAVPEAALYRVYRGPLSSMADGDDDGRPDAGYGECQNFRDPDPADTLFLDNDQPLAPGEGFVYFVSFVSAAEERGLGNTSAGLRREPGTACP
jgi:hypothetical protein